MRIRITDLPEFKTRGYYQNDISLPPLPIYQSLGMFPSPAQSSGSGFLNMLSKSLKGNPNGVQGAYDQFIGPQQPKWFADKPMTTTTTTMNPNNLSTGIRNASILTAGLHMVGNKMNQDDYENKFNSVKFGMSDNQFGTTPNQMSKGMFAMNYNQPGTGYDPTQFGGNKIAPKFGYGQDGTMVGAMGMDRPALAAEIPALNQMPTPTAGNEPTNHIYESYPQDDAAADVDFKKYIASKESGGNYEALPKDRSGKIVSSAVGKYQFLWNQHKGWISQVTGVGSKEDFMHNPEAQEVAFDYWDANILTPQAKKIQKELGVKLPLNQIKAKIHFAGPAGAYDYFKSGKETQDAFGTTTSSYGSDVMEDGGVVNNNPINENVMTRKIRISEVPEFKTGGVTPGMSIGAQLNYGLYRGGLLKTNLQGTEAAQDELRDTYPEAPLGKKDGKSKTVNEANINIEKGEYVIPPDMEQIYKAGGEKHYNGGKNIFAEPGTYVVSDHIKVDPKVVEALGYNPDDYKKKTIADFLTKNVDSKAYNYHSNILKSKENGKEVDKYELNSALYNMQDYKKRVSDAVALGELSKAQQGKEYNLPPMAMHALQKFMPQQQAQEEQREMPQMPRGREESAEQQPMAEMARDGKYLPMFQNGNTKHYNVEGGVDAGFAVAPPTGYSPYNPAQYPELYWKKGQAGSTQPGGFSGGYNVAGGRSNVSVDNILQHPEIYKTFHRNMEGAPDDIKKQAAMALYKSGKMPGKYTPGATTAAIPSKFVYTGQPATSTGGDTGTTGGGSSYTKKEEQNNQEQNYTYQGNSKKPWWTQDIMRSAFALSQAPTAQYPHLQQVNLPRAQRTFIAPNYNPIMSQMNNARRNAAMLGAPQQYALSGMQPLDAVNQITYQTNAGNVDIANRGEQLDAETAAREALTNAQLKKGFYDETQQTIGNLAKEKEMYGAQKLGAIMQGMTDAQKTQVWNDSFGRAYKFGINPNYSQRTLSFLPGTGNSIFQQAATGMSGAAGGAGNLDQMSQLYNDALTKFGGNKEAAWNWVEYNNPQLRSRTKMSYDASGNMNYNYTQPGQMQQAMMMMNMLPFLGGGQQT